MSADATDHPCIETKKSFRPPEEITVAEYDARFERVKSHVDPFRARFWVGGAPPVEALIPDGYEGHRGWVRVLDREAYDVQMRKLLGIL